MLESDVVMFSHNEMRNQEFRANGSIPCEGGGLPGDWCAGCRFGKVHNPEYANDPE